MELTQRFRRQVAPYDVVSSLTFGVGNAYCPALQTIKAGAYNIDRATTPSLLIANVLATAKDDSGSVGSVQDSAVTNLKWMVQGGSESAGTDITLRSDWAGEFTVGTGADKGTLTISKNVPAGTTWKIWLECDVNDMRRGFSVPIHVVTDSVLLFSVAEADDQYTMSIDRPSGEVYEPALDKLLVHEYLTGLGEASTYVDDGSSYLRIVNVALRKGGTPMASGYDIKIFQIGAAGARTEVTSATDRNIESVSGSEITFNLRFAQSAQYQIACFVGTDEVARKNYGWVWSDLYPTTDEGLVGGATYVDGSEQSYRPKFNFAATLLEHPTVAYQLDWYYRKSNNALVYVGSGESQSFDLSVNDMFSSGEAEAVLQIQKRGAFDYVGEGSDRLTDGNGNYYVEN